MTEFRAWSDRDQSVAMALTTYERMLCSGCGHPLHESMDPANEGRYSVSSTRCHACTAIHRLTGDISAHPDHYAPVPEGLRFSASLPAGAPGAT